MADMVALMAEFTKLTWALLPYFALWVLRKEIQALIPRLQKLKAGPGGLEVDAALDGLQKDAKALQTEVAQVPSPTVKALPPRQLEIKAEADAIRRIAAQAAQSPRAALVSVSVQMEQLLLELLAVSGHLRGRQFVPTMQAIAELKTAVGMPNHLSDAARSFWKARNLLIHEAQGNEAEIMRAVDSGIAILRALQAIPRMRSVVSNPHVELYEDRELKTKLTNVHGVLLAVTHPAKAEVEYRIHATSRTHFKRGKEVSLEWNQAKKFGPAWFKDEATGMPKEAWIESMEFVGRHIDELENERPDPDVDFP